MCSDGKHDLQADSDPMRPACACDPPAPAHQSQSAHPAAQEGRVNSPLDRLTRLVILRMIRAIPRNKRKELLSAPKQ
jgi:hypothetical protein